MGGDVYFVFFPFFFQEGHGCEEVHGAPAPPPPVVKKKAHCGFVFPLTVRDVTAYTTSCAMQ